MVSQCLNNVTYQEGEHPHICLSCDKQMKCTPNLYPLMPYYGDYASVAAGAKFLKAFSKRYHNMFVHVVITCYFAKMFILSTLTTTIYPMSLLQNLYSIVT